MVPLEVTIRDHGLIWKSDNSESVRIEDSMLEEKIRATEAQMKAKLAEARATFSHQGNKGEQVEAAFRAFLQQYLPRRLSVGHGEVVDKCGARSSQTDVVIANEDHPFTFTPEEPGIFFIEGVCAGGEVKSVLTSQQLESTIENSRKWKRLLMKPGKGTMIHTNDADLNRFYKSPPYFLVAMESQLTLETVHEKLVAEGSFGTDSKNNILDGAFLLDRGWVIDFGSGKGAFQYRLRNGTLTSGWQRQPSDRVLFDLLGWLSACMPKMIQFESIILAYMIPNIEDRKPD